MIQKELIGDLKLKWDRIQQAMRKINADGCLLTVDVNLYYTTGRIYSGYFYLPAEGAPWFFVKRPNGLAWRSCRIHPQTGTDWPSSSRSTDWKCRKSFCSKPTN